MSRPTVFITQEPRPDRITGEAMRDFTPAEHWGKIRVLLAHDAIFKGGDDLVRQLRKAGIDDYKPGDGIIPAGHPAVIGVAIAMAARLAPVRILVWSGRQRGYVPMDIDLTEK